MMLKALPLVHFWSVLVLKNVKKRKTDRFLAKFALKITTKSAVFYRLLFGEVCPENAREIGRFFREFLPKIPGNLTFSSETYQKPC